MLTIKTVCKVSPSQCWVKYTWRPNFTIQILKVLVDGSVAIGAIWYATVCMGHPEVLQAVVCCEATQSCGRQWFTHGSSDRISGVLARRAASSGHHAQIGVDSENIMTSVKISEWSAIITETAQIQITEYQGVKNFTLVARMQNSSSIWYWN